MTELSTAALSRNQARAVVLLAIRPVAKDIDITITLRTACIQYICAYALELMQPHAIIGASRQTI